MSRPAPIIEYAHKINKNTAEFTVNDLVAFMKWWTKQPVRKDILTMRSEYMQKNKKTSKTVGNKVDQSNIDDGEAQEAQEEAQAEQEVVCEMGLTQLDIDALKWALHEIFQNYDLTDSTYEAPLTELNENLNSL